MPSGHHISNEKREDIKTVFFRLGMSAETIHDTFFEGRDETSNSYITLSRVQKIISGRSFRVLIEQNAI